VGDTEGDTDDKEHAALFPRLDPARWWLTPSWAPRVEQKYAMFNARSETLGSSRAFRRPFARQRGVVPMSSFIEWRQEGAVKQPWLITSDSGALAAAALWDIWTDEAAGSTLLSCALVTTAAAPEFAPWHQRMPVLLTVAECDRWLDNRQPVPEDDPLFRSALKFPLQLAPLASAIGNARNKDTALLRPVSDPICLQPGRGQAGS
jgi:putative SOS response-associated peptidase YedK